MKSIHIDAGGDTAWIGGLYYKRNIVFMLLQNDYIRNHYNIIVTVNKGNEKIYFPFSNKIILKIINRYGIKYKFKQLINIFKYNIQFNFPGKINSLESILGVRQIEWIPDFQHKIYPEFFSQKEIERRDTEYKKIEKSKFPLILSSYNALKDFNQFYGDKKKVYVVPFVSFIEPELNSISEGFEKNILNKYGIETCSYVCISNQFWKHKNHLVVFKAIELLTEKLDENVRFVFTGYPDDKRNPEYFNELMTYIKDPKIKKYVLILGFLDRLEQLVIMKKAQFIIQPSLFEGWGTVVEDAKVLDKTILLSDIEVHREQRNHKCILFNPHNPKELAELIKNELYRSHCDFPEKGVADMYIRAKEYSKGFENLLKSYVHKKED